MSIGIIGVGVVGGAVYKSLIEKYPDVIAYDKFKNIGSFDDIIGTDMILLCLPTPFDNQIKAYDLSSIHEICERLSKINYAGLVIVKSTVEPTTSQKLADTYNLSIAHNPEFLSAKTAYEDFRDQSHIIIGSTRQTKDDHLKLLVNFYKTYYPNATISLCTSTESESIKIFCNNFYSVKIQFFTEIYLLCQRLQIDYNVVRDTMLKNGWINPMHTIVPGTDGNISYGGMCFPKDTNALLSFMKSVGSPCQVLEAVVSEHNSMREEF